MALLSCRLALIVCSYQDLLDRLEYRSLECCKFKPFWDDMLLQENLNYIFCADFVVSAWSNVNKVCNTEVSGPRLTCLGLLASFPGFCGNAEPQKQCPAPQEASLSADKPYRCPQIQ